MAVYCVGKGRGVITSYSEGATYPIAVVFSDVIPYPTIRTFTAGGLLNVEDNEPKLSFRPWVLPDDWNVPPDLDISKGALLWVRKTDSQKWLPRYFSHWEKGEAVCYLEGRTLVSWKQWKMYKEEVEE